ncbi:MAG: cytochrome c4 [Pseudomonadales bacterium]|nr:cytochrome c4 [Pseudomonadales bacterium]
MPKIARILRVLQAPLLLCTALALGSSLALAGGDATAGKKLVGSCAACHGKDGNSASPANPKLAGQGEAYLLKQLRDIKSGTREIALMAGQLDRMSEQQLADIAAYFASQTQTAGVAQPGLVALGREIYRNGNLERGIAACTGCHGPAGLGNAPAKYPMIAGQHADYIAQQLRHFAEGRRVNDGEGRVMRGIAERMNENEIKAVASYIEGLRL